jgi:dipeptidyl aminopeptidase/acylaminoacyl peptidase
MKTVRRIAVALIVLILIGFGYATWYFSTQVVAFTPRSNEQLIAATPFNDLGVFGVTPEEITFSTYEFSDTKTGKKLTLAGWFVPGKTADAPTFVVLHGRDDSRVGATKYVGMLAKAGYAVLAYDQRHHGKSEGDYSTYGWYEGYDVSAAIDYLAARGDCNVDRLGILGESMGGATAIMAAARDKRIKLLIDDSAYRDLTSLIVDQAKKMFGLPRFPFVDAALWVGGLRAHFDPKAVSPLKEIARVTVPTLIIHCTGDVDVRPEYSEEIYEASNAVVKEIHFFDGCIHRQGYEDHTAEYEALVLGFIEDNMPAAAR